MSDAARLSAAYKSGFERGLAGEDNAFDGPSRMFGTMQSEQEDNAQLAGYRDGLRSRAARMSTVAVDECNGDAESEHEIDSSTEDNEGGTETSSSGYSYLGIVGWSVG